MKLTKKISAAAATSALALGALFGAAPAAEAWNGWYTLSSKPYEAIAHVQMWAPNQGTWRAYAKLGSQDQWGARSVWETKAVLRWGWHTTHDAKIFRNGALYYQG